MCGVAGLVALNDQPIEALSERLDAMAVALHHRGPDQAGTWVRPDGLVGLANTRLSIVGVRDRIEVPFRDRQKRGVLSYNGEIYNFRELRDQLRQHGVRFESTTDTEVLMQGLLHEGLDFLDKADGVWGFAFYDAANGTLNLVRDLIGEKPLYFCRSGNVLAFASEVDAVLAGLDRKNWEWDWPSVVSAFQNRAAPPGRTLLKGVERLLPGYSMSLRPGTSDADMARIQSLDGKRYLELYLQNENPEPIMARLAEALAQSCRNRLPSDVDYIATLSGGIDSSLVNSFLCEVDPARHSSLYGHSTPEPPRKKRDLDEFATASLVSDRLGTPLHGFSMMEAESYRVYLDAASRSLDGIFCEGVGAVALLAGEADRLGKRVLVLSDGPDELMGGYDVDLALHKNGIRLAHCLSAGQRAELAHRAYASNVGRRRSGGLLNWAATQSMPFGTRPNHGGTRPEVMTRIFRTDLLSGSVAPFGHLSDEVCRGLDASQKVAMTYAQASLPDYINTRADRGSMSQSIEVRQPFMARQVVELLLAAPAKWRFGSQSWSKYLLRRVLDSRLGPEVAYREKYGFAAPIWRYWPISMDAEIDETIRGSKILADNAFRDSATEELLRPARRRERWMAYCLAVSEKRLTEALGYPFSAGAPRGA
jgi:asparagine synthase (glutamine-hydrolysing)